MEAGMSLLTLLHGTDAPLQIMGHKQAGNISVQLDGIDLRFGMYGSTEVFRRIYMAVRDAEWNTIPAIYRITRSESSPSSFTICFNATQEDRDKNIDFEWKGQIIGTADGTIRYEMNGLANSDFLYGRIGLCVLHPETCAGKPYVANSVSAINEGFLPSLIGPQKIINGETKALFPPYTDLTISMSENVEVGFHFTGDLFEMEDQRNWTDASLKTYSTPLATGLVHQAKVGQRFRQSVVVRVRDTGTSLEPIETKHTLRVGHPLHVRMPKIGVELPSSDKMTFSDKFQRMILRMHPDHIRVNVMFPNHNWMDVTQAALGACKEMDVPVELALFTNELSAVDMQRLAAVVDDQKCTQIARILLFYEGNAEVVPEHMVAITREALQLDSLETKLIIGTNKNFCELNRIRPDVDQVAGVSYRINPLVHASDDLSVMETVVVHGDTVKTAQSFCSKDVVVSPVSISPNNLQDPRATSLFGAAWTLGSLKHLIEAQPTSITYSVLEHCSDTVGNNCVQGGVAPACYILNDLFELRDGTVVECNSSHPMEILGLAISLNDNLHILVGNMRPERKSVQLQGVYGHATKIRCLSNLSVITALSAFDEFVNTYEEIAIHKGVICLNLRPYETVRIDVDRNTLNK